VHIRIVPGWLEGVGGVTGEAFGQVAADVEDGLDRDVSEPGCDDRVREQSAIREADVASREREMALADERLRSTGEQLLRWEAELHALAQRVKPASKMAVSAATARPRLVAMTVVRAVPGSSTSTATALPLDYPTQFPDNGIVGRMPVRGRTGVLDNARRIC
jgi:hypothetical protein